MWPLPPDSARGSTQRCSHSDDTDVQHFSDGGLLRPGPSLLAITTRQPLEEQVQRMRRLRTEDDLRPYQLQRHSAAPSPRQGVVGRRCPLLRWAHRGALGFRAHRTKASRLAPNHVGLRDTRAVSESLVLIIELADGHRIGVPHHAIGPCSDVREPGDCGVLTLRHDVAVALGVVG